MERQPSSPFPHGPILQRLQERCLIPFLGAAASFVGSSGPLNLPDGSGLAREILDGIAYPGSPTDSLTKISQFVEEGPADRRYLLEKVRRRFDEGIAESYRTSFVDFIESLPEQLIPPLIITTNYDVLVERSLQRRNVPYLAMCQVMRGNKYAGRWLCYSDLSSPLSLLSIIPMRELEERLKEQQIAAETRPERRVIWVYKIHGTARLRVGEELVDSIVMTEGDYIDFLARDILKAIPTAVTSLLRKSSMLFLGYSLADWNFRVLLQRIRQLQVRGDNTTPRHWAFLLQREPVEEQFWKLRGVNVYQLSLEHCLTALTKALRQDGNDRA